MIEVCDDDGSSFASNELSWRKEKGLKMYHGIVAEVQCVVVASACNDEIDQTISVEIGGEHADKGAVVVGRDRQVGGWKKMAGFVGERDEMRALGGMLHAGYVGDAVVVEVDDHDVREHVIAVVDGEVDRLSVARALVEV